MIYQKLEKRLAISCMILLCNSPVSAQTVPVRTGEHADFTRIVLDFDQRPGWRIGRNSGRYELWLDSTGIEFDLTDAFRRLQGQRLIGLTDLGQGRLAFDLTCNCGLSVVALPNQGLLIDVQDKSPADGSPWLEELTASQPLNADQFQKVTEDARNFGLQSNRSSSAQQPDFNFLYNAASNERWVTALQTSLAEQTARAASQGLIKMNTTITTEAPYGSAKPKISAVDSVNLSASAISSDLLAPNIRIETQYDRDNRSLATPETREQLYECLASDLIDINSWFVEGTVLAQLGVARTKLIDDRDQQDPAAYAKLAKMLIYLSFGAEARAILQQGPEKTPGRDTLLELATLVDGKSDIKINTLQTQINCDSAGAMWALLDNNVELQPSQINSNAIIRTVSSMPQHLRQHIGPRIVNKLLDIDMIEAALQVRNAVLRGSAIKTPEIKMLEANPDLNSGDRVIANEKLASVAFTSSDQAIEALIGIIDEKISSGDLISDDIISHSIAMTLGLSDQYGTEGLPYAIIAALIYRLDFDSALKEMDFFNSRSYFKDELSQELMSKIFMSITENTDDASFLRLTMNASMNGKIPFGARLQVASRLVRLGMAEQSRAALGRPLDIPGDEERYILASIAILEKKRNISLGYLTGLETAEAAALRIQAEKIDTNETTSTGNIQDMEIDANDSSTSLFNEQSKGGAVERNRLLLLDTKAIREDLLLVLQSQLSR